MDRPPKRHATSRRTFLKITAMGGATALLHPRVGKPEAPARSYAEADVAAASAPGLFSDAERSALSTLADLVLPGAGTWGAVDYIERLLTSFDGDPARLYAGTMGSGDDWLPLDRVRERAWRLRIHGSAVVEHPNEALLGPVVGLRPRVAEGAREAAARLAEGAGPEWVWWRLSGAFRESFTELVIEGTLGDPIYGGNRAGAAWRAFHFDGAMLGYGTYLPESHAGHGQEAEPVGPDPLGPFTRAALWMMGFFSRRIA